MTPSLPDPEDVSRGAAVYTSSMLRVYDLYVVGFNNRFVWRCPAKVMLRQYDANLTGRHLEVGPGTGWYLDHATFPCAQPALTLVDLNPNSLEKAGARVQRYSPELIQADVFSPLPVAGQFDSAAANYLFHCLPGSWDTKSVAVRNIAERLTADGVLFGATILGRDVHHGFLGRQTMKRFNASGIFHNTDDHIEGLRAALSSAFREVSIDLVGAVALFTARHRH
ncbi:class I SAM-dependent methyltransferase [Mycobacterium sp. SMC-4]|uniref:class I SAM-dependent methyltransferase n=1 Tax=Mycobacterium sp. SMC-4 TaxID=2857059 RepID=UPI0021B1BEBC|nr:class I SAM-dependent methyltransferase [Mycobacterium sp. SMC-4]UXA16993.1 class I SAM-dependent methyltransferase [Mycobacterium sp. SMC-4]